MDKEKKSARELADMIALRMKVAADADRDASRFLDQFSVSSAE